MNADKFIMLKSDEDPKQNIEIISCEDHLMFIDIVFKIKEPYYGNEECSLCEVKLNVAK